MKKSAATLILLGIYLFQFNLGILASGENEEKSYLDDNLNNLTAVHQKIIDGIISISVNYQTKTIMKFKNSMIKILNDEIVKNSQNLQNILQPIKIYVKDVETMESKNGTEKNFETFRLYYEYKNLRVKYNKFMYRMANVDYSMDEKHLISLFSEIRFITLVPLSNSYYKFFGEFYNEIGEYIDSLSNIERERNVEIVDISDGVALMVTSGTGLYLKYSIPISKLQRKFLQIILPEITELIEEFTTKVNECFKNIIHDLSEINVENVAVQEHMKYINEFIATVEELKKSSEPNKYIKILYNLVYSFSQNSYIRSIHAKSKTYSKLEDSFLAFVYKRNFPQKDMQDFQVKVETLAPAALERILKQMDEVIGTLSEEEKEYEIDFLDIYNAVKKIESLDRKFSQIISLGEPIVVKREVLIIFDSMHSHLLV